MKDKENSLGTFELIYENGDVQKGEIGSQIRGALNKAGHRPMQYRLHLNRSTDARDISKFCEWVERLNTALAELRSIDANETNIYEALYKSPLGITPRKIWLEERLSDIHEAIRRCISEEGYITPDWITEHNIIARELYSNI